MDSKNQPPTTPASPLQVRKQKKRENALRENLMKRKQQDRARQQKEKE